MGTADLMGTANGDQMGTGTTYGMAKGDQIRHSGFTRLPFIQKYYKIPKSHTFSKDFPLFQITL